MPIHPSRHLYRVDTTLSGTLPSKPAKDEDQHARRRKQKPPAGNPTLAAHIVRFENQSGLTRFSRAPRGLPG
jgi:hypothetical protein